MIPMGDETPSFSSMHLTAVEVLKLLAKGILAAAKGKLVIPCAIRNRKSTLTDFIMANLTPALEGSLSGLLNRQLQPSATTAAMDKK